MHSQKPAALSLGSLWIGNPSNADYRLHGRYHSSRHHPPFPDHDPRHHHHQHRGDPWTEEEMSREYRRRFKLRNKLEARQARWAAHAHGHPYYDSARHYNRCAFSKKAIAVWVIAGGIAATIITAAKDVAASSAASTSSFHSSSSAMPLPLRPIGHGEHSCMPFSWRCNNQGAVTAAEKDAGKQGLYFPSSAMDDGNSSSGGGGVHRAGLDADHLDEERQRIRDFGDFSAHDPPPSLTSSQRLRHCLPWHSGHNRNRDR